MTKTVRIARLAVPAALACGLAVAAEKPAAKPTAPSGAPSLREVRDAEVQGVGDGSAIRLHNGRYQGPPYAVGGAEAPRVELLGSWTATGPLDDSPAPYRLVLLSESTGGTGSRLYVAVFGWRDGKVANVATRTVGDRVQPRGLSLDGRTIVLDVGEQGPADPLCCPTQAGRRSFELRPEGLLEVPDVGFVFKRSQIVLPASVGAAAGLHFLLDTGTDPSIVDLETAARLGLPADVRTSMNVAMDGGEPRTAHPSGISGLRIGTEEIPPIDAVAMDLSDVSRRLGVDVAGILGRSFFRGRIVQIDYPRRRVRLYPAPPPVPANAFVVPLKVSEEHHAPLLEDAVQVNGKRIRVTLDTGSSLGLEIYANAREALGSELWQGAARVGRRLGVGGEDLVRHVAAGSIWLGPFPLDNRDLVLSFSEDERGPREGNLGNAALESFVLTLDDRSGQVIFARP